MRIAGTLGLLLALAVAVLLGWYVLRLARRRALGTPAGAAPQGDDGALAVAAGLVPAVRAAFAGREEESGAAYHAPLVLLAGEPGSGKSALLDDSSAPSGPLRWHELPQGWVLAADTAYLGLDDQDGAEAWQALAEELQRRRPRRPLDGILLTIAADTLVGPQAWLAAELERRAALAQRRLGEMQSLFGLRLPVYLLITRADQLDGFASFASTLPDGMRQAMLGWSSPHALDAAFNPEWIPDGFQELSRTICALQTEMAAAGAAIDDSDAFFLLPGAVAALAAPVRSYAARLLGDSAHSVTPMFRGLYLCGDPASATDALPARPWFAGDLLARKIFPERGVARPLDGQLLSRNKLVRRWAAACAAVLLVWGGALAWSHYDLRGKAQVLLASLKSIDDEQQKRIAVRAQQGGHMGYDDYKTAAQSVMNAMVDNRGDLSYAAIPASWRWTGWQQLDAGIEREFSEGLAIIVYRTLDKGLNLHAKTLTGASSHPVSTTLDEDQPCKVDAAPDSEVLEPGVALADSAPFKRLARFVAEAGAFEQARKHLDLLQADGKGGYDDLVKVAAYTGAFELPSQSEQGLSSLLKTVLRKAKGPEDAKQQRERQKGSLECAFRQHSEQFYTRTLDESPVLKAEVAIGAQLRGGNTLGKNGQYQQLIPALHNMALWLKSPSLRWLDEGDTGEGKAYGALLQQVSANTLLGPDLAQSAKGERAARAAALEQALLSAEGGGNAILQRGADGRLALTPELANLKSGLDRLMRQSFIGPVPAAALGTSSAPGPLWDLKLLTRELLLADEARSYLDKELRAFPAQFQAELKRYTDQRVADNLMANAAQAQQKSSSEAEVYERLGQVSKPLTALLDTLRGLGAEQQRAALAAIVATQASHGLRWLERDLVQGGLYRPRDDGFGWWQGTPNPAAQGFAGGDPQGLEDYLQAQQARIETAVRQAQPLLRLLEAGEGSLKSQEARHWTELAAELARFQDKQPNARMAQLHAYIRGELAAADASHCMPAGAAPTAALAAAPASRAPTLPVAWSAAAPTTLSASFGGGDLFSERRRALAAALAGRCRELASDDASKGYLDLKQLFRRTLAGRFPFADASRATDTAELDDVLAYLQRYDQTALDSQRIAPGRARDFVAASGRVRAFLAPLMPPAEGGEGPGYELAVRFRVNSGGEADGNNALAGEMGGNRIAAWMLQSGDERISWTSTAKGTVQSLPWRPGMPLVLTLRWADNVAALPYNDGRDRYMSVSGRDVVYRYSEPWSLLRMLARQRVTPAGAARHETLRFDIPTAPAGIPPTAKSAAPGSDDTARVFLRMNVTQARKKEALAYPQFPAAAPGDEQAVLIARP
jgi:type VI secretion system protein ImpL